MHTTYAHKRYPQGPIHLNCYCAYLFFYTHFFVYVVIECLFSADLKQNFSVSRQIDISLYYNTYLTV